MNYRTTRIYLRSLDLIDRVARVIKTLPPGYAFLADQIRRSASSIPLNYLEGCGRSGAADRRRFFSIAIGSAHEVAATLDVMQRFDILSRDERNAGQDVCDHLIAMLRRFR
jgi:four helix bundle protein